MNKPPEKTLRRSTRVLSEAVREVAEARAVRAPLVVTGISPGRLVTIEPKQFARMDVDPSYQRGETSMVDEIIRAIQSGGVVLDPVTICKRPWAADKEKMWIVDGHQRVCAFQQLGQSFTAILHESDSHDSEKKFFLSLNSRRAISPDVLIRSWTGPCAKMIVAADEDMKHPLFDRIKTTQGNNPSKIGGIVLVRGMLVACTGIKPVGSGAKLLGRLDTAIGMPERRFLAEQFLRLVGHVFYRGRLVYMISVLAVAEVAYKRWVAGEDFPTKEIITRLGAIKWETEVPAYGMKFIPVLTALVEKAWPKSTRPRV